MYCSLCQKHVSPNNHVSAPDNIVITDKSEHLSLVKNTWDSAYPRILSNRIWYHPEHAPNIPEFSKEDAQWHHKDGANAPARAETRLGGVAHNKEFIKTQAFGSHFEYIEMSIYRQIRGMLSF